MANANVRKGRAAERAVMLLAQSMGIEAIEGRKAGRSDDQGDIWLWPTGEGARVVIQVKDEASKIAKGVGFPPWGKLQKYWQAAEEQALRVPNCDLCLVVVKKPGSGAANAADWWAFAAADDMSLWAGSADRWLGLAVPAMWPLGALLAWLAATA